MKFSSHSIPVTILSITLLIFYYPSFAQESPLIWESTYTANPPVMDGDIDSVWTTSKALLVPIREAIGGADSGDVILRALHTSDSLYVLAQWADSTRSDMRDPYIWNSEKAEYERPTTPDDQFALEFPLDGDFQVTMLPTAGSYIADVWHWKAGRSNLGGWVDDKRHIVSSEPMEDALVYSMGGHNTVYMVRPMDEGRPSYATITKPTIFEGDVIPSFEAQEPNGSVSDIVGKGVHDGRGWALEMTRKFNTGNADDTVLDPTMVITCAIARLNDELYFNHSVSQAISLRFLPR